MNAFTSIKSAWKSAQLLIAFHQNKDGRTREDPRLWSPKNGVAGVSDNPKAKESFVAVRGEGDAGDVQIKLHPEQIIVRRDPDSIGWAGVQIDHYEVRVLVGDVWITVKADGSVKREVEGEDHDQSWLEADGSYIRLSPDVEINVSGDGSSLSRRTEDRIEVIDDDGVLSRPHSRGKRPLAHHRPAAVTKE